MGVSFCIGWEREKKGLLFRKKEERVSCSIRWRPMERNSGQHWWESNWSMLGIQHTHTQLLITHRLMPPGELQYYVRCHKRMKLWLPHHLQQLVTGCEGVSVEIYSAQLIKIELLNSFLLYEHAPEAVAVSFFTTLPTPLARSSSTLM